MKKSKHFRKDVILARIIAGVLLIVLIVLIVWGVSLLNKSPGEGKEDQNSQYTENTNLNEPEVEGDSQQTPVPEDQDSENDSEINNEDTIYVPDKIFIETTTQVRLREEPNTNCATLDRINGGTKLEVLETLDGWYKVNYNGQDGYVSADYTEIVEE